MIQIFDEEEILPQKMRYILMTASIVDNRVSTISFTTPYINTPQTSSRIVESVFKTTMNNLLKKPPL